MVTGRSVSRRGSQPLPLPARGSGGGGTGGAAAAWAPPLSFTGGIGGFGGGGGGGGGGEAPSDGRLTPVAESRTALELDGKFIRVCWNCLGRGGIGLSSGELVLETVAVEPRACWSAPS